MTMTKLKAISLVPLSLAGAALAQVVGTGTGPVTSSSVTLFGIVDVAVAWGKGDVSDRTRLVSGSQTPSRLGFRGVEELGGGLGVGFWLEAGVNADDGSGQPSNSNNQASGAGTCAVTNTAALDPTLAATCANTAAGSQGVLFNRRSTVSMLSGFGELRLGRDFTATYRNRDHTDPFGTSGVGANLADILKIAGVTGTRASNMIGYFLPPNLGGFFGELQYYLGENASNAANDNDGSGYQGRLGWASGPFGVAVAAGKTKYATTATLGDIKSWNVGGHFDFGVARLTGGWFEDKVDQLVAIKATGYIVGAVVPFGPHQFKASFSQYETDETSNPEARKLAIGYVYNMSKRSSAYATYARLENKGSSAAALNNSVTAPGQKSDGVDIGLTHRF
jgi:predicted porin